MRKLSILFLILSVLIILFAIPSTALTPNYNVSDQQLLQILNASFSYTSPNTSTTLKEWPYGKVGSDFPYSAYGRTTSSKLTVSSRVFQVIFPVYMYQLDSAYFQLFYSSTLQASQPVLEFVSGNDVFEVSYTTPQLEQILKSQSGSTYTYESVYTISNKDYPEGITGIDLVRLTWNNCSSVPSGFTFGIFGINSTGGATSSETAVTSTLALIQQSLSDLNDGVAALDANTSSLSTDLSEIQSIADDLKDGQELILYSSSGDTVYVNSVTNRQTSITNEVNNIISVMEEYKNEPTQTQINNIIDNSIDPDVDFEVVSDTFSDVFEIPLISSIFVLIASMLLLSYIFFGKRG